MKEGRRQTAVLESGWAGVMSLPMTIEPMSPGNLRIAPVEELKALRGENCHFDAAEFEFFLCRSQNGLEQTRLIYQGKQIRLVIDPSESSLSTVVDRDLHKAPLTLDENGRLRLHIFLDRSVLEVFANDHICLTCRIYPTLPDSLELDLISNHGNVKMVSLDVWKFNGIWF